MFTVPTACLLSPFYLCVFFFKQKTAYEMRISDWSSDVCSSDLQALPQKEMQILRELTGSDPDADTLLRPALAIARRRVVVKRPSHAPFLAGREPAFQLQGPQARSAVQITDPVANP